MSHHLRRSVIDRFGRAQAFDGVSTPLRGWLAVFLLVATGHCLAQSAPPQIAWHPWSEDIFTQAMREHKLILLDVEAFGCHWCHVMEQQTYGDPDVQRLMDEHYLAVKVDQDSRPDIANRYEQFGSPVTILLQADASEIVRKAGYISKANMASLLQAVVDDPSPGPSITPDAPLSYAQRPSFPPELIVTLNRTFISPLPPDQGSDFGLKYLDADSIEYAEVLAGRNHGSQGSAVHELLTAAQQLLDPIWGGAFQSLIVPVASADPHRGKQYFRIQFGGRPDPTGASWNDPHYEKLLSVQAQMIRIFAHAYRRWRNPQYLDAAVRIHRYVQNYLTSPEAAFYASQDSDIPGEVSMALYFSMNDAQRRTVGVPRVDKRVYARENGWMIDALCALYAVTNDATILQEARLAADWVMSHRALNNGGFTHGADDSAGPYLSDTLAMSQAFLSLYAVTGEREWLKRALRSEHFISKTFSNPPEPGFVTSNLPIDRHYGPHANRNENVLLARMANLLFRYSSDPDAKQTAAQAMQYLATPDVAAAGPPASVLMAEREFRTDPLDVLVMGSKRDKTAQSLFQSAIGAAPTYKRVEWWDPAEGPLPREGLNYPAIPAVAAILCRSPPCSAPISDPQVFEARITAAAEW